jgi:D-beta-D-heptose 7-phosphate kinase/D-beta-D-heptose 1-phosphate adenosyltransferase
VLSDYAKGVLTRRVIAEVIAAARKLGKPVIVDPKSRDFTIYRGATLLTPNRKELAEATGEHASTDAEIIEAAKGAMQGVDCEAIIVTRSEHGMSLVPRNGAPVHVPAYAVKVVDVSGPGDTVAAVLAVMLATGASYETALRAANAAAAVVVGKRGTATVSVDELRARLLPHAVLAAEEKIVGSLEALDGHVKAWKRQGLRVGFTNGVFDLLHPGHVKVLTQARAACDRLIVGLNSDASVKRLKGPERPLQNARARAEVLAALEAVDLVVMFEEDTPLNLITRIVPSVLVKGGDYSREQVVGHDIVEAAGGEVVLVETVAGMSTTSLVDRSRGRSK